MSIAACRNRRSGWRSRSPVIFRPIGIACCRAQVSVVLEGVPRPAARWYSAALVQADQRQGIRGRQRSTPAGAIAVPREQYSADENAGSLSARGRASTAGPADAPCHGTSRPPSPTIAPRLPSQHLSASLPASNAASKLECRHPLMAAVELRERLPHRGVAQGDLRGGGRVDFDRHRRLGRRLRQQQGRCGKQRLARVPAQGRRDLQDRRGDLRVARAISSVSASAAGHKSPRSLRTPRSIACLQRGAMPTTARMPRPHARARRKPQQDRSPASPVRRRVRGRWAEACPRHHGQRHQTERACRPCMNTGTRRDVLGPQHRGACQQEAERHERIGRVKHEDEPVAPCPVAGPAGKSRRMKHAGRKQQHAAHDRARRRNPADQRGRSAARLTASKRANGCGTRPGLTRTIQLWVKLGTMRPPISITSISAAAMRDADAVVGRSAQHDFGVEHDVAGDQNRQHPEHPQITRQFFPAWISRITTAASVRRNATSIVAATSGPILVDSRIAIRPANQSATSAASGAPFTGNRPVQFGIAVSRKPATVAAT